MSRWHMGRPITPGPINPIFTPLPAWIFWKINGLYEREDNDEAATQGNPYRRSQAKVTESICPFYAAGFQVI